MSVRFTYALIVAIFAPAANLRASGLPSEPDASAAIAALIDKYIAADWAARGIQPAAPADDAELVRRVYLDVVGRIPKVAETREFLEDPSPNKRAALVDKLLTMPSHASYFAAATRAAWLPQTLNNIQYFGYGIQFENWLRNQFRDNVPADELVRRVLTVGFAIDSNQPTAFRIQPRPNEPDGLALTGFYRANDGSPENLAAAVSKLFVGVKLECAQCHDHPFARYTREQFWEFAAFFAELTPAAPPKSSQAGPVEPQSRINRLKIPKTDRTIVARYFDGTEPQWSEQRLPREELAQWLTSRNNEFFAKNLANRMWAHFFGFGIQDPLDEPGDNSPPSHPELLVELGKAFAAAKFDNRVLIRGIVRSRAYQLSSRQTHASQANPRHFARMNLKGLTPSQLFDSLVTATGHREPLAMKQNPAPRVQPDNPRSEFSYRFASTERATEATVSILQSLMLMNGKFVAEVTSLEKGEVLAAIAEMPGWDAKKRVSTLFLAAFARYPTDSELERFSSYIERGGASGDQKRALADLFWVLLNSPEFSSNH